jgi:RHS repeat-associated protein
VTTALGNTPRLFSISPPPNRVSGTRTFAFDGAGNQTTMTDSGGELFGTDTFAYSEESKLKKLSLSYGPAESAITYDGRGFLRKAELTYTTPGSTEVERAEPTYSSFGLLFARHGFKQRTRRDPETGMSIVVPPIDKTTDVFYFAGRPVAQRTSFVDGVPGFLYLTTDHLGTPVIATDAGGAQVWPSWKVPNSPTAGGLEPFGGMFAFAQGTEVFLRFAGQWEDGAWWTSARSASVYYNVNRWFDSHTGRYSQRDPLGRRGDYNVFAYAYDNPLNLIDPLGLKVCRCDRRLSGQPFGPAGPFHHTFVEITLPGLPCGEFGTAWGLEPLTFTLTRAEGRVFPENTPTHLGPFPSDPDLSCSEIPCIDEPKLLTNIMGDMHQSIPYVTLQGAPGKCVPGEMNCFNWADDVLNRSRDPLCCPIRQVHP